MGQPFQEFDSPQLHVFNHLEPATGAVFRFMKTNPDKTRTEFMLYKPPQLKGEWPNKFVQYYFRDPASDKWKRFKVYEEINRNKSAAYDNLLMKSVLDALRGGFNPFTTIAKLTAEPDTYTIQKALRLFLAKWNERGLDASSYKKYRQTVELFENWLLGKGLQFRPADDITAQQVEDFLRDSKTQHKWSNRTYNNYKSFLSTCFIFLEQKKIIRGNPCREVATQKTTSKKHKYYDDVTLKKVMDYMKENDPALHFACLIVYHLCVRSEKELQHLKVGNILPDRKQVLLEVTKGKADRYIPANEQILKVIKAKGVLRANKDYYVFSGTGKPGAAKFGEGFFSKRFRKVRQALGLDTDRTIYSFKHTRIIHLKKDGASDAEIMALTGHKDFQSYAIYLRDIGADVNPEKIHRLTRDV